MSEKKYNIIIATGIYPPEIGGPAQYAEMLLNGFNRREDKAKVVTYGWIKKLPTGLRHIVYFFQLMPAVFNSDTVIILDTFSSALPAVLSAKLFNKIIIVRVGGDFLWEEYVERIREPILLSDFYKIPRQYSFKEKMIFSLTKFVFEKTDIVVFSTQWQKDIMICPYKIDSDKIRIIENLYENRQKRVLIPKKKIILSPSRNRFLKNKISAQKALKILAEKYPDIIFDDSISSSKKLEERIQNCYCLLVPSFSEISPNIVLQAVSFGVPVVVTSDCGIRDRLGNTAIWVNPLLPQSIADGVNKLLDINKYYEQLNIISRFSFIHSEQDIIGEFLDIINKLKR